LVDTLTNKTDEPPEPLWGPVIWLTGLSGAGKSTLANALKTALGVEGKTVRILDGDDVRQGLCADLGFSPSDRAENIRRVGEVAALFAETGVWTIVAFISPYKLDRDTARARIGEANFIEVYLDASLETCERRDVKGLYKRARAGKIENFTGISAPYEQPEKPELVVDTFVDSLETSVAAVLSFLHRRY